MPATDPGLPGYFKVLIALMIILLVIGVIVGTWRAVVLRRAGLNPLIADTQLQARLAGSQVLAPGRTTEERLAELTDLHQRGIISDDELAAARLKVISGD